MMELNQSYWNHQYQNDRTGWDMGYASPPLVEYIDQLEDKSMRILVPGAGNAWEVEYLWEKGFKQTYLLDFSKEAISNFRNRFPEFPKNQILEANFFNHQNQYHLILEQTFFTSLLPVQRENYVHKMYELLKEDGKLVGVVFNHEFHFKGPPFGAKPEIYRKLLEPLFHLKVFEPAYNSIKPRKGREHFLIAERKIKI